MHDGVFGGQNLLGDQFVHQLGTSCAPVRVAATGHFLRWAAHSDMLFSWTYRDHNLLWNNRTQLGGGSKLQLLKPTGPQLVHVRQLGTSLCTSWTFLRLRAQLVRQIDSNHGSSSPSRYEAQRTSLRGQDCIFRDHKSPLSSPCAS